MLGTVVIHSGSQCRPVVHKGASILMPGLTSFSFVWLTVFAGLQRPAASAASNHGLGLSRKRPLGLSSPAGGASSASISSSGSLASRAPALGIGRGGGRLGLGMRSSGTGGGSGTAGVASNAAGLGAGLGSNGMFGGAAFRVPGLRRPKRN